MISYEDLKPGTRILVNLNIGTPDEEYTVCECDLVKSHKTEWASSEAVFAHQVDNHPADYGIVMLKEIKKILS